MSRYRKRPVIVDAIRWTGENPDELRQLAGDRPWWITEDGPAVMIPTREGTMAANPGDWVIRGAAGELYPCQPDIFTATYQPVEAGPA